MLACPKCGYDNELGRVFCHQCGTKLDLDQIKPPSRGGKRIKGKSTFSVWRLTSLLLRLAVLGVLIWGIVLFWMVPEIRTITTVPNDLTGFFRIRDKVYLAEGRNQPYTGVLTETQLNAFIDTLKFEVRKGSGVQVAPTNLQLELGDNEVIAIILGQIRVANWTKALAFTYVGKPMLVNGQFTLAPKRAAIGKLAIPRVLLEHTSLIQSYFLQVFGDLKEERQLLDKLSELKVSPQQAELRVQPAAK